jgi:hypothetical protein
LFYYDILKLEIEDIRYEQKTRINGCEWQYGNKKNSKIATIDKGGGLLFW